MSFGLLTFLAQPWFVVAWYAMLGFLDFGGTTVSVSASRLVFGRARALGPTRVVLATLATTPGDVRAELTR